MDSGEGARTPEAADARARTLGMDPSVIPSGPYCYRPKGEIHTGPGGLPVFPVEPCPYWAIHPGKKSQENGYCAFLGDGDWSGEGVTHLWDQVKACGIADGFEDLPEEAA